VGGADLEDDAWDSRWGVVLRRTLREVSANTSTGRRTGRSARGVLPPQPASAANTSIVVIMHRVRTASTLRGRRAGGKKRGLVAAAGRD
jgi:hypothetical protein